MKTLITFSTALFLSLSLTTIFAQTSESRLRVAVLNLDTKEIAQDAGGLGDLLRLELQRTEEFEVFDKYDMLDMLSNTDIDLNSCYSRRCMLEVGTFLEADKVISGSVQHVGDKILVTLKMLDVESNSVERTNVSEYLDMEKEVQYMLKLSINKLLGKENDQTLVNTLTYYSTLTVAPTTKIINNGPRMGAVLFQGRTAQRLSASLDEGGYGMTPFMTQFGYQHEVQYMSSGNFQALFEFIGMISGLEQSNALPSLAILNGFRETKYGLEFGFGPTFGVRKVAQGYFDLSDGGKWKLRNQYDGTNPDGEWIENPYPIEEALDRRGNPELYTRWIWSVGKTFRSGYLNIPVNVFGSYLKDDWSIGLSMGFNLRRPRRG